MKNKNTSLSVICCALAGILSIFLTGCPTGSSGGGGKGVGDILEAGNYQIHIDKTNEAQGSISASPKGAANKDAPVIITVSPKTNYEVDKVSVLKHSDNSDIGVTVGLKAGAAKNTWEFAMPDYAVTVTAAFRLIGTSPALYAVSKGTLVNGDISFTGVDAESKAAAGATVTVTALPANGYETDGSPVSTPSVAFTPVGTDKWTFPMPAQDIAVTIGFKPVAAVSKDAVKIYSNGVFNSALGNLSIVLNRVQTGAFGNSLAFVDANAAVAVEKNNGHNNAIEIKRGGTPETSGGRDDVAFSIVSDNLVDLSGVSGLSFMIYYPGNVNGGWFPVKWIAFGDSDVTNAKHMVWYGTNNNANYLVKPDEQPGWTRIILPVPRVSNDFKANCVFSIRVTIGGAVPEYFLIDDIEFLPSDAVKLSAITLLRTSYPAVQAGISYNAVDMVSPQENSGIDFTYTTTAESGIDPAVSTVINSRPIDQPRGFDAWGLQNDYTFTLNNADATLSGSGAGTTVTPVTSGGSFELRLRIGPQGTGITSGNALAVSILGDNEKILEDFEAGNSSGDGGNGYWKTFGWSGIQDNPGVAHGGSKWHVYKFTKNGHNDPVWWNQKAQLRAGRNFPTAQDLSGFANGGSLLFWIAGEYSNDLNNGGAGDVEALTFSFSLHTGGTYEGAGPDYVDNNLGALYTEDFSFTGSYAKGKDARGWMKMQIPLSVFTAKGLNLTAVTGWSFELKVTDHDKQLTQTGGNGEYGVRIDDVKVEK